MTYSQLTAAPTQLFSRAGFVSLCLALATITFTAAPFRLPGNLTLSDYILIFALACAAPWRISNTYAKLAFAGSALYFLSLLITAAATYNDAKFIIEALKLFFATGLGIATCTSLINSRKRLDIAIAATAAGLCVNALFSLLQMRTGQSYFFHAPNFWGRFAGLSEHPNELGPACAIFFSVCLYFAVNARGRGQLAYAALSGLLAIGILTSASMTAAAGAALGFVGAFVGQRRPFTMLTGVVTTMVATPALMGAITVAGEGGLNSLGARLERFARGGAEYETAASRLNSFDNSWRIVSENPFIGHRMVGELPHNFLLFAWHHGGVLALIGVSILVASILTGLLRLYAAKWRSSLIPGAMLTACVVFILAISLSPPAVRRSTWAFCWLGAAAIGVHLQTRTTPDRIVLVKRPS